MTQRPDRTEAPEYHIRYIDQVVLAPGDDIIDYLTAQQDDVLALCARVSDAESHRRYAPDKWSLRQVLNHVSDTERVFASRAMWFGRGLAGGLPDFDHVVAAAAAGADDRSWASHTEDFRAVRAATLSLVRNFPGDAWMRRGIASGNTFTVRAVVFIAAGHAAHHLRIVRERYLSA